MPEVPFALLAAVQLTAVAAWGALAGGVLFPGLRRWTSLPLAAGALVLAGADVATGSDLGTVSSQALMVVRVVGGILIAVGLLAGAPRPTTPLLTVAPLGAVALPPALLATGSLLVAAGLALRRPAPRPPGAPLLATGLALSAASAGTALVADRSAAAALGVLALRGLGACALLAWSARLARGSLLAKVVASILVSVVAASVVLAAVVGSVVTRRLDRQQATTVAAAASRAVATLDTQRPQAQLFANSLQNRANAAGIVALNTGAEVVTGEVASGGAAVYREGTTARLAPETIADLARQPVVRGLLEGGGSGSGQSLVVLRGPRPVVVLLSVTAVPPSAPGLAVPRVVLYGLVVDERLLTLLGGRSAAFATSVVALDGQVASADDPQAALWVGGDPRVRAAAATPPAEGVPRVLVSQAGEQTLGVSVLYSDAGDPVALLVVSAPAAEVLSAQRTVLQVLFVALVGTALATALLAVLLGRQVVRPVRRLTATAERVRGGDLDARAEVDGRDEVAQLALGFDAMTASLQTAAGELRATAEQEAQLRARLQTVLASIAEGLVVADASDRVESVNPAGEQLVGPAARAVGRRLDEVVVGVPLDRVGVVEGVLRVPGRGAVPVVLARQALADGRGTVVVLRDRTQEREAERMKTQFLANVSHELRTPLTPIQGYADILVRRAATLDPARTAQYAEVVLASSKRLARVVDLLVDVAALDAGRVQPTASALDLQAFLAERVVEWRERAPERGGDVGCACAADLPPALVDAALLAKAVDELVENALAASPAGSPVALGAGQSEEGRLLVTVRDEGAGIPRERIEALFADFEQVDGSSTRSRDGLGLGLAYVRRVTDVIDVDVRVDSTEGAGTTFTLQVPSAAGRAGSPAARRTALGAGRGRR